MKVKKARLIADGLTALIVLAADRLTKMAARTLPEGGVTAIENVLAWHYCENTGAAFGSFSGAGILLCLVTAVIIAAALVWYLRHGDCNRWTAAGLTLLIAGGLGNLYDRLTLGYVVDFIEVLFVRFAVFNVSDIAVVCGTFCLVIGLWKAEEGKA